MPPYFAENRALIGYKHIPAINARTRHGILEIPIRRIRAKTRICRKNLFDRALGSPFDTLRSAAFPASSALCECTNIFISASLVFKGIFNCYYILSQKFVFVKGFFKKSIILDAISNFDEIFALDLLIMHNDVKKGLKKAFFYIKIPTISLFRKHMLIK